MYTGTNDTGYLKQTKKQFIVWSLFSAAVIGAFYAYFICVTRAYSNRLDKSSKKEKKEEAPKDEPKEDAKKEDSEPKKEEGDMAAEGDKAE